MTSQLIPLNEAASLINKSTQTLRRLIKGNKIKFRRKRTPQGFIYFVDKKYLFEYFHIPFLEPQNNETHNTIKNEKINPSYFSHYIPNLGDNNLPEQNEEIIDSEEEIEADKSVKENPSQIAAEWDWAEKKIENTALLAKKEINNEPQKNSAAVTRENTDNNTFIPPQEKPELPEIKPELILPSEQEQNDHISQTDEAADKANNKAIEKAAEEDFPANYPDRKIKQNVVLDEEKDNMEGSEDEKKENYIHQKKEIKKIEEASPPPQEQIKLIARLQESIHMLINQHGEEKKNWLKEKETHYLLLSQFQERIKMLEEIRNRQLEESKKNIHIKPWWKFWVFD